MKRATIFFGATLFCNFVIASSLDGFDGKEWGTTLSEIIEERGDPLLGFKRSDLWVWDATESETVGGYQIKSVYYNLKNCSDADFFTDEMWGGSYSFSQPSEQLFDDIFPKLVAIYGEGSEEEVIEEEKRKFIKRIFTLGDGSKVSLTFGETTEDPPNPLSVTVQYSSADREFHLKYVCAAMLENKNSVEDKKRNKDF